MTDFALISKKEAAARLAVSERTIDRLRADGDLDAVKVRGSIRIPVAAIDDYLARARDRNGAERRAFDPLRANRQRASESSFASIEDMFPIPGLDGRRREAA